MPPNQCSIDGCDGEAESRGWCGKHYGRSWCRKHWRRWKKYGDPLGKAEPKPVRLCDIDNCTGKHVGLDYCGTHLYRFKTHGNPLPSVTGSRAAICCW